MNCKSFNDVLHEYLDETLDAEDQAAAREHLRRCDPCRSALLRERAFSESVGRSFDRTTAGLSLRSGMRQDVLRALESEPASSSAWSGILRRLFSLRLRPAGAMATFLGVALLILVAALHHHVSRDSAPQAVKSKITSRLEKKVRSHLPNRRFFMDEPRAYTSMPVDSIAD